MSSARFEDFFPFLKLGLERNPFGALTTKEWVAVTVLPPMLQQVVDEGFQHLQVIGDRGRGKSTSLHWLCYHLRSQGQSIAYERLPAWQYNYHTDISVLDCFALDEAQRLWFWHKNRLFHEAQGKRLIIGTHHDISADFRRRGWQIVTIAIGQQSSPEHIRQILDKRLEVFATDAGVQIYFDDSAVDYLWERWRDNLRGMEFFLYFTLQKRRDTGAISADYLIQAGRDYKEPKGLY